METSWSVTTLASVAQKVVYGTFVDVRARFARAIHLVARIVNATVGTD